MNDPTIIPLPDVHLIEQEAAEWIMRLQRDDVAASDIVSFEKWRTQSVRHKDIFEGLSQFWDGLDFVEQLTDYAQNDAAVEPLKQDRIARTMSLVKRVFKGAIAASIIAIVSVPAYNYATKADRQFTAHYATDIGEQETIDLPDGSQIILNTNSEISVTYSKLSREIFLSRGEAFFDVASNKSKPFSVNTDEGTVTAVGTAFSVHLTEGKLDVLVTEGRVMLFATPKQPFAGAVALRQPIIPSQVLEVSAGQSAVLDNGIKMIAMVQPLVFEKETDWQDGELSFNGETLEEVIQEISRYTDLTIEISGDQLRSQRIVAYYKVGDIERLFEALNVMANIEVDRTNTTHVELYRSE
ncbi:MAG: FecR domain-containing protein [Robiginitomaculum sp.]|nr:FecR domain-containing protein [Robiginitomaculum sp.]